MKTAHRTAAEQKFWDDAFLLAYADALRRDTRRSDESRITWAQVRADGALDARRRSQAEQP